MQVQKQKAEFETCLVAILTKMPNSECLLLKFQPGGKDIN